MITVILTGGASRRMGTDKAMLPWNGETMLQYLINKYSSALGKVAVSVNKPGRFSFEGAEELADRFPDMGPMNGIISAFENSDEDTLFLTGTDLPFGEPALVLRLAEFLDGHDACIIRRGVKGSEPLFAVYDRKCLAAAERCMEAGEKSLLRLIGRLDVRYVTDDELGGFDLDRILMNVNTMDEYKKASR